MFFWYFSSPWIRIPNPDPDPETRLNTDPIRIRIRNTDLNTQPHYFSPIQKGISHKGKKPHQRSVVLAQHFGGAMLRSKKKCGKGEHFRPAGELQQQIPKSLACRASAVGRAFDFGHEGRKFAPRSVNGVRVATTSLH